MSFVVRHLSLIAAILIALFTARTATATSDIVVASQDLFPNQIISVGDVHVAQVRDALPGSFSSADGLTGLQVVSRVPKGYPVVKGSVRGKSGVGLTLADAIPDGDHAIYKLDSRQAQLPAGYVKAGDQVLVSVVLKVDPQQEAQARAALATPTPTAQSSSQKATPTLTPTSSPGQQVAASQQGAIILGSAYLAAPVMATDGLDGKSSSPGLTPWLSVLLSIDDLNALNTLVNSGFAQATVSLADSRIKPVVTVNSLASLVAVLEQRQSATGSQDHTPIAAGIPAPSGPPMSAPPPTPGAVLTKAAEPAR